MAYRIVALILICCCVLQSGCSAPVIELPPPFPGRLEPGDMIKITTKDGTVVRGRIVSLDINAVTLGVGRRTTRAYPYEVEASTERVDWQDVETLEARAILDAWGKLTTEEEIRENTLWKDRLQWVLNGVLFGAGAGLYVAANEVEEVDTRAFWYRPSIGATTGAVLGYLIGRRLDRDRAIRRIERAREVQDQQQH